MSRRGRPHSLLGKPAELELGKRIVEATPEPIAVDAGGPWYLKEPDDGTVVKPFLVADNEEQARELARQVIEETESDEPEDEHLTESVTLYAQLEELADKRIATHADRAARRLRGMGDHERAKTFEMLAKIARGE